MEVHEREIRIATPDGDMSFDLTRMGDEAYRARLMSIVSAVTPDAALADTEAVLALAAAGIHPSALVTDAPSSPHHDLGTVRGELYFAFAEIDQSATEEVVDRFLQELEAQGVEGVVERLPGVAHGFAM